MLSFYIILNNLSYIFSQKGERGDTGLNGIIGYFGEKGDIGETGNNGIPGYTFLTFF